MLLTITSTCVPSAKALEGLKLTFTPVGMPPAEKFVTSLNPKKVLYVKLNFTMLGMQTVFV